MAMPETTTATPATRFRAARVEVRVTAFWLAVGLMFTFLAVAPWPALPGPWARPLVFGLLATAGGFGVTRACIARASDFDRLGMALGRSSFRRCLIGVGIGVGIASLHFGVIHLASGVRLERVPEIGLETLPLFGAVYVALSAMEEVAFRGYPLRALHARYGLWPAQIVVALAFAVYHLLGGQDVLSAFLGTGMGSLLFGMAALATRGLAVPIGLHAAWNYVEWAVGGKGDPGPWRFVIDEASLPTVRTAGTVSYFAVLGAATFAFWLRYRAARPNGEREW